MSTRHGLPEYQRGAVLFMALIYLLIMTLLGVSGLNLSRMENVMAGNSRFQLQALGKSELAVREIENTLLDITQDNKTGIPDFGLDNEYYRTGEVDTTAPDWNGITHATTSNGSRYLIEYDHPVWKGNSIKWQGSGLTANVFRITCQTRSGKGTQRTLQVVYGTDEAP